MREEKGGVVNRRVGTLWLLWCGLQRIGVVNRIAGPLVAEAEGRSQRFGGSGGDRVANLHGSQSP